VPLARENELFGAADAATQSHDLEAALAKLRIYDHDTAGGTCNLTRDMAALEVEVLCRLHDSDASAALLRFEHQWGYTGEYKRLLLVCSK
jgi:hypothetical protein